MLWGRVTSASESGGGAWCLGALVVIFFMYKALLIILALFAATTASAQPGWTWEWISPLPQGNPLNDIHFISSTDGIAIAQGFVFRTTDAGATWNPLDLGLRPSEGLYDLSFIDERRGMIAGASGLLRTDDGGATWERLDYPAGRSAFRVAWSPAGFVVAVDYESKGYRLDGNNTLLYRSTDHGESWSQVAVDPTLRLMEIAFVDDNVLVSGRGENSHDSSVALYRSTDGGATWTATDTLPEREIDRFRFGGGERGLVAADRRVYATTDRGISWSPISPVLDQYSLRDVVPFGSSGLLAISSTRGVAFLSEDSGATWDTISIDSTSNGYSGFGGVAMSDSKTGTLLGLRGSMFRTSDGGRSWSPLPMERYPRLADVMFDAPGVGIIVGAGGTILRTEDGGRGWEKITSGTTANLGSVAMADGSGLIVGDSGVILRTDDAGRSWSRQISPDTGLGYVAVDMVDAHNAMALASGTIIGTMQWLWHPGRSSQLPMEALAGRWSTMIHCISSATGICTTSR
jgi:photosystem II stability/assembly factor-like uncharacterized protein